MTNGTFRRVKAPRYAKPAQHQAANVITTRLCPVCHEPRLTRYGKIAPHQRSRDERGAAIWPAVWCAGRWQDCAGQWRGGKRGSQPR